jgi:phospholipid-binding lipoprotein MlaA
MIRSIRGQGVRLVSCALVCSVLLSGCATGGIEEDPLEGFNRSVFAFNETFDDAIAKPVARGYQTVVPDPADKAITNFFGNLADIGTAINNLLQLKILHAFEDAGRIVFNTTFGLGGLIVFAGGVGMEKHQEDFGQTLGYWGAKSGAYLVLPFLGPSSVRDAFGLAVDSFVFDPVFYINDTETAVALGGLRAVDRRADLLKTERILSQVALDRYSFIRSAYLQRRENQIRDGDSSE